MFSVKTILSTLGSAEIYSQIKVFENQYRGRELPGFVNYMTFENIIKKQIKVLEEPAVDMLHKVTGEYRNAVQGHGGSLSEASHSLGWSSLKLGSCNPLRRSQNLGAGFPGLVYWVKAETLSLGLGYTSFLAQSCSQKPGTTVGTGWT